LPTPDRPIFAPENLPGFGVALGRQNVSVGGESPPYDNIGTRNNLLHRDKFTDKPTPSIHAACKAETPRKPNETVFGQISGGAE
jgi:hypothetical protein